MSDPAVAPEETPATPPPADPAVAAAPPAAPPAAPAPAGDPESWIPEALQGIKTLEKFKTPEDALNAYVNLEKRMGDGKSVNIPGPESTPEEKVAFFKTLGCPDEAGGYDVTAPEMPGEIGWDVGVESSFKGIAHEAGLNSEQVQKILNWYGQNTIKGNDVMTANAAEAVRETMEALHEKWGIGKDRNLALAQRARDDFGTPELDALLKVVGPDGVMVGNSPHMIEMLSKIGEALLEDGHISGVSVGTSTQSAQDEIAVTIADKDHAYHNRDDAGHKAAVERMTGLYKVAYPQGKKA